MRNIKNLFINSLIILFFCGMYVILTQEFSIISIIVGIVIAVISILVANLFICDINYHNLFKVNMFMFLWYMPFLLFKIVTSGINTIGYIVKNNATCKFFNYQSDLDSDFKLNLLSNSITLTPGTVTVDRQGSKLLVMQMRYVGEDYDDSDIKKMEQKIKKI